MAVNDESNNTQDQANQRPAQQPYAAAQSTTRTTAQPKQGLSNLNQLLARSGSYDRSESRSAEVLRALRESGTAAVEAQGLAEDFELLRFDRDSNRVGLSSILVVKTVRNQTGLYAAVRTLILDAEEIRLPPKVIDLGGQRIETPTRPQDIYNDVYWSRIVEFLRKARGDAELNVVDAGPLVITSDYDVASPHVVTRLLVTSVNRCDDMIARIGGEVPFTVSHVKRDDERLTARIDFSGPPAADVVGNPIRSDIVIAMKRQSTSNVARDDYYEHETEFNSVSGFVNLEYTPPQAPQQPIGWGQQQMPTQMFTPSFVITDVRNADWIQAQTPELYLLAISNAFRVTAGTSWVRTFLPQVGKKGIDTRDIGALGFLTAAATKPDTKSDKFSDADFVELMTQLVRPQPAFLIDINPVGEHAAVENLFIDAAFPGPNQERAKNRLLQAANALTGGAFQSKFDANQPIVVPYGQEVHLGYYIGDDGERHDIRDLDVLAMLNLTNGNVNEFIDWYRTYCDPNILPALALQKREGVERAYLSKSLKVTGRAVRLLLSPQFIEALDAATREAGVQVDLENVTTLMGGQRFVGNTLVNNYVVTHSAQMGYGGTVNQGGGQATYGGVTTTGRMY